MITDEQMKNLAVAATTGFAAILYVIKDENWPAFAAFAGHSTGKPWTLQDREQMRIDARILFGLSEAADPS